MTHDTALDVAFGQATHPEIDTVDALDNHCPVFTRHQRDVRVGHLEGGNRVAFKHQVRIGLLEPRDHVIRQVVAALEVLPGCIGLHVQVGQFDGFPDIGVGRGRQAGLHLVQRSKTHIPAPCHVEGKEVGADADQIVTHRIHHLEVDLFGRLLHHAAQDGVHTILRIARLRDVSHTCQCTHGLGTHDVDGSVAVHVDAEGIRVVGRVQEGIEQRNIGRPTFGIKKGQGLTDLRVAEAVGCRGELVADACIGRRIVLVMTVTARPLQPAQKSIGEVVEHDLLIFRLVQGFGRLEQFLRGALEARGLEQFHMVVVVACPDGVHRGQTDVFIRAPIAAHEVVKRVHERVLVDQKRPGFSHEVADQIRDSGSIVVAFGIQQIRVVLQKGDVAHVSAREHGLVLDVVIQKFPQRRHQAEAFVRRIRLTQQNLCPHAAIAIAFAQQLTNQRGRAVDLVLIHEGRGDVLVQRHTIVIIAHHRGAGQVGRVVRTGRHGHAGAADLDRPVASLRDEGQAVIEVLTEGHHEHVDRGCLGRVRVLRTQGVRDSTRIEAFEDRVDLTVARRLVIFAITRFGDADIGLIRGAKARVDQVVFHAQQVAAADDEVGRFSRHITLFRRKCGRRALTRDHVLQRIHIGLRQGDLTPRQLVDAGLVHGADIHQDGFRGGAGHDDTGLDAGLGRQEADAALAVGQGHHAVGLGADHIGQYGALGQDDHILFADRAHDGVIAAGAAEQDPVRRGQCADVDVVIAIGAVDGDRVEGQRGRVEVTEDLDVVDATACVDLDLLDIGQLCDHRLFATCNHAGDDDIGARLQRCAGPGPRRIDAEGLVRGIAVRGEGVAIRATVDHIRSATDAPGDVITACAGHQDVIARTASDDVTAITGIDHQALVRQEAREVDDLVTRRAVHVDRVGRQRGQGEVADRVDCLDPLHTVDGDLFDPADFHDRGFHTVGRPGDDDLGQRVQRLRATGRRPGRHRVHGKAGFGAVAIDDQHVGAAIVDEAMPGHHVIPAIGRVPGDGVRPCFGKDQVITGQTVDLVVARTRQDHVRPVGAVDHIRRSCSDEDTVAGRIGAQVNLHVGKAQNLDVPQRIAPIADFRVRLAVVGVDPQVGLGRDGDVFHGHAAIVIGTDVVICPHVEIDSRIGVAFLAAVQDFPHDLQLARVDGTVEQLVGDFDQAVHRLKFDGRIIGVTHRDTDVQEAVTVDDIVAAAALDHVAAAATQQDVAAREGLQRVRAHQVAQQFAQTFDPVDARLGQFVAKERGFVDQRISTRRQVCADPVVTIDQVGMCGSRYRFRVDVAVADHIEAGQFQTARQVHIGPHQRILVGDPVMSQVGIVHMHAFTLDQDVVAAFAKQVVVIGAPVQNVMANDARATKGIAIVAHQHIETIAAFDPVVAFATEHDLGAGATIDEVVTFTAEGFGRIVGPHQDRVIPRAAEHQFGDAATGRDDVVAILAMQERDVVAIADDIIARTAAQRVHARPADQQVVAGTTPERVVAQAADQDVTLRRTAQHHMLAAVELQQVVVFARTLNQCRIHRGGRPLHQRCTHAGEERIDVFGSGIGNRLHRLVHFKDVFHRREDIGRDMRAAILDVGVAHDDRGEGVVLQFGQHVHACGPRQVIEAVAVLQDLHLVLEYETKA